MSGAAGMTAVKAVIAGGIAALAFAATAHAADPAGTWPPPAQYEPPAPRYKELVSGWYLRGDIGYRLNSVGSVDSSTPVTSQSYENALSGTLGFGYKYRWFRADLTLDRGVPAGFKGTTAAALSQPQYTSKVNSLSAMANLYFDLGTWFGFTPYIGGGAGATKLESASSNDSSLPPPSPEISGKSLNFSWAVMAGVAYQVTPSWMIDVGYRYLTLGDVAMIGSTGANNPAVLKNVTAQEARIGVRFLFD